MGELHGREKDIVIKAQAREGRGKNDSRRARRNGQVPVIIYGGEGESVAALAPLSELAAILRSDTGRNTIFTVDVEGVGASEVMFQDRQIDPVRVRLIHADFKRLVKGEKSKPRFRCGWWASLLACASSRACSNRSCATSTFVVSRVRFPNTSIST